MELEHNFVKTSWICPNCGKPLVSIFRKDGTKMGHNSSATIYCANDSCDGFDSPIELFTDGIFTK